MGSISIFRSLGSSQMMISLGWVHAGSNFICAKFRSDSFWFHWVLVDFWKRFFLFVRVVLFIKFRGGRNSSSAAALSASQPIGARRESEISCVRLCRQPGGLSISSSERSCVRLVRWSLFFTGWRRMGFLQQSYQRWLLFLQSVDLEALFSSLWKLKSFQNSCYIESCSTCMKH